MNPEQPASENSEQPSAEPQATPRVLPAAEVMARTRPQLTLPPPPAKEQAP